MSASTLEIGMFSRQPEPRSMSGLELVVSGMELGNEVHEPNFTLVSHGGPWYCDGNLDFFKALII